MTTGSCWSVPLCSETSVPFTCDWRGALMDVSSSFTAVCLSVAFIGPRGPGIFPWMLLLCSWFGRSISSFVMGAFSEGLGTPLACEEGMEEAAWADGCESFDLDGGASCDIVFAAGFAGGSCFCGCCAKGFIPSLDGRELGALRRGDRRLEGGCSPEVPAVGRRRPPDSRGCYIKRRIKIFQDFKRACVQWRNYNIES